MHAALSWSLTKSYAISDGLSWKISSFPRKDTEFNTNQTYLVENLIFKESLEAFALT